MDEYDNLTTVLDNKKSGRLILVSLPLALGLGCFLLYSQFPGISYPNATQLGKTKYDMHFLNGEVEDELSLGFAFDQKFEWNTQDTLQDIGSYLISKGWFNDVTLHGTTYQYRAKPKLENYGPFLIQHSNWIKVKQNNELDALSGSTIATIYIWIEIDTSIFP